MQPACIAGMTVPTGRHECKSDGGQTMLDRPAIVDEFALVELDEAPVQRTGSLWLQRIAAYPFQQLAGGGATLSSVSENIHILCLAMFDVASMLRSAALRSVMPMSLLTWVAPVRPRMKKK